MNIAVQIEPANGQPPEVEYRWDTDTDILTATVHSRGVGEGMSGTVGLQGSDGSWLNIDVSSGRIHAVEVAVWPDVRKVPRLEPPTEVEYARVKVPTRQSQPGLASIEVDTPLLAESDQAERTIHFRVGVSRQARTIRVARDVLLDVDPHGRIAGLWLLNVPPFPADS